MGEDAFDLAAAFAEGGIVGAELVDDDASHLGQEGFGQTELAALADGAAEEAAEDVGTALVAGEDAVGDQERGTAGVVGDDAEGAVGLRVGAVGGVRETGGGLDDRPGRDRYRRSSGRPA